MSHYQKELEGEDERTWKIRQFAPNPNVWRIDSRQVDHIALDRLYAIAQYNTDMAARVKAVFESMKGQEMDESRLLQKQMEETTARIARLNFLLKNPNIPLDEKTAAEYATELAELHPKLERLTKKLHAQPDIDPEKTITNFYFVLAHVATEFEKQRRDVQKQIMSKLVKKVVINNLSPHLFSLYIEWHEGVAFQPDIALLWRGVALKDNTGWTEEDAAIRTYWPEGSELDVLSNIPKRTRKTIIGRASALGVKRLTKKEGKMKVYHYAISLTYADIQAVERYLENDISADCLALFDPLFPNGLTQLTKEDRAAMKKGVVEKVNELAETTKKGEVSAYFPLSAELLGSFPLIGSGGQYPCLSPSITDKGSGSI